MTQEILVLCDERDLQIGAAVRAEIALRGGEAALETCDPSEESLGPRVRDALSRARKVIVVVREGGRGNRLLHAAEDEAPDGVSVASVLADATPDGSVSARTHARIRTLGDSLVAPGGASSGPTPRERARARKGLIALVLGAAAVFAIGLAILFLRGPSVTPLGGPPVVLTGMLSNSGWMVTFHLREEASRLEYKLPSDREFRSTGEMGPTSGPDRDKAHANLFATLPDLHGKVPLQVRYFTLGGAERGPFEVVFDVDEQSVSSVRKTMEMVPDWISFRLFDGRKLCYFSFLLSSKYAYRAIRYGVDTDTPNRSVRFSPGDKPGIAGDDEIFIDLPRDVSSVTVEVTFLDGTTAKKRFPVRF